METIATQHENGLGHDDKHDEQEIDPPLEGFPTSGTSRRRAHPSCYEQHHFNMR